ncbi:manganese transporter [Lactococcus cremoris subsp. cremoris IBB477]|uniref:Manganese transporter n=1 Tax=Lactococcus cremoris subsp. cremoris IBB477 TaxID=1449093 RepID=A0A1E7G1K3_LACLC|nr:Nramp family divalent metal transporter [Lactococcus cremoris]OEU38836.1 manganese transporter [Lactococcus cremoris subsp. cremoris IBB477]
MKKIKMRRFLQDKRHPALDFLKYVGPGLIVAVGFIDPGNWATNLAAGSQFGYKLLWVITLSTIMLAFLQHNVAHLGIVTGKCLSENATQYLRPWLSRTILGTGVLASISTAVAEILGGAIALQMLFKLPIVIGAILTAGLVIWFLFSNSYPKIEKVIIGFVSLIGIALLLEIFIIPHINWGQAAKGMVIPFVDAKSMPIIMSALGAVVMPHNLFLHSEVIQSRQWNLKDEAVMERQLRFEFFDTIFSMFLGWVINSAIIIIAAALFFPRIVTEISQAQEMLVPLLGPVAAILFAIAFLFAGVASSVTAGMAGGSIFAGIFAEPYDAQDPHSKLGVLITIIGATLAICGLSFVTSSFNILIYSQVFLSIQLPITIFLQIYLTSSKKVMGKYKNVWFTKWLLLATGIFVTLLNIVLIVETFK